MQKTKRCKYTKQDILNMLENASMNMDTFYRRVQQIDEETNAVSSFEPINYRSCTNDTNEFITEIAAQWLLERIDLFDNVTMITRNSTYNILSHDEIPPTPDTNQHEKVLAMKFYTQKGIPGLGAILNYEVPLSDVRTDSKGEVDLLAYDGINLNLLELKRKNRDTMLKCVVQIYTYLKSVDQSKLLKDFHLSHDIRITASPLVEIGSKQYKEYHYHEMNALRKLMAELNITPLFYEETSDGLIIVKEEPYNEN